MTREQVVERGRTAVRWVRERVTWPRVRRWVLVGGSTALVAIALEAAIRGRIPSAEARLPTALYTREVPWGAEVSDDDAEPVAIGALDGSPLEYRVPLTLDRFGRPLIQAVLAVEDQRFRDHHGLDLRRIAGAMVANVRAGGIAQGGSTITQQLAKNLFLSADRTPLRKVREAALALALELRYDKDRILEAYLNEIYLGQDGGRALHGMGAASRYYFGKEPRKLSLGEAATLAGMIHAPNRHTPTRHAEAARDRRDLVLSLMAEQGRVSRADAARAAKSGLAARPRPLRTIDARHFRDYALPLAPKGLPARGGAVYTTIDATLQRAAERAVKTGLDRFRARGVEAALVAIDPRNGDVLAMVGGRDYGASQFNRAVLARRQPGSAFKPVVALAALARGDDGAPPYTLASVIEDEPISVRTPNGPWEPANYDGGYRGPVTFRQAMEQSLNVPFARIGLTVGPERIAATGKRLGIASPLRAVPSLALGSSEVTLLELTRAYGVLATGGELAPTRIALAKETPKDGRAEAGPVASERVADPAVAYLVTSALEGVVTRGTGAALGEYGVEGLAGKTGTSNNWRDAWFVAYTPTLVVGVWVGYDDERSLGMTGATAALPIASRFLGESHALERAESFEVPAGISEGYVTGSADAWVEGCGAREVFLEGTEPSGGGCMHFEMPEWDGRDGWSGDLSREVGRRLGRRAEQALEALIQRQIERARSQLAERWRDR